MVQINLSEDEARILTKLLKIAGEEFSNHGCNDFNVGRELGVSQERAIEIAHTMHEKMIDLGVDEEGTRRESPYLLDSMLFSYFEVLFRERIAPGAPNKG